MLKAYDNLPFCFYIEKEASGQSYTPEKNNVE